MTNPIVEAQRRYVEQYGDPLGAQWPKLHALTSQIAVFGSNGMKSGEREALAQLGAKINLAEFRRLHEKIEAECEVNGAEALADSADFQQYSFLDPSSDLANLVKVGGMSKQDWIGAIGDRQAEDLEGCELGPCCGTISAIRNMLIRAQVNGGLLPTDVTKLQALLDNHEPPTRQSQLEKIFTQLGVTWANKEAK